MERIGSAPDVSLLLATGNPDRYRILEFLLGGPASQRELAEALDLNSGTLSKHMAVLSEVGLVERDRSHGPYELRFRDGVVRLLQANVNLMEERELEQLARSREQRRRLNEAALRRAGAATDSEAG